MDKIKDCAMLKIGFYGDSYIDVIDRKGDTWPEILCSENNYKGFYYGRSGTSNWYAYQMFLKTITEVDIVIFSHTNPWRWPHLPDQFIGKNWNIGVIKDNTELDTLNSYFDDIFPKNLLNFIGQSIFHEVNEVCTSNGVKCINVIPFNVEINFDTIFPVVTNLEHISNTEKIKHNNSYVGTNELIFKESLQDHRKCHMNSNNNIKFSKLINNIIKDFSHKTIDVMDYEWDVYAE